MTLAADIADDYTFMDGVETVTVTFRPAGTQVTTVKALRRTTNWRELNAGLQGNFEIGTEVFQLFNATLSSNIPKNGDLITDSDSKKYTIKSVIKATLGTRWDCICNQYS